MIITALLCRTLANVRSATYRTRDVSSLLTQDVLLCAGAEDHFVPLHQLYDQARWLTQARSVTTRIFTAMIAGGRLLSLFLIAVLVLAVTALVKY